MRKSLISENYLSKEVTNKNQEIHNSTFQPLPEDIDDSLPWDLRKKSSNFLSKNDLCLLALGYEKTKQDILLAFWDPS